MASLGQHANANVELIHSRSVIVFEWKSGRNKRSCYSYVSSTKKHRRLTEAFSSPSNKQFKAETLIFILDFNGFSTTNSAFYCSVALHEILMLLSSVYKAGLNSVRIETAQL